MKFYNRQVKKIVEKIIADLTELTTRKKKQSYVHVKKEVISSK